VNRLVDRLGDRLGDGPARVAVLSENRVEGMAVLYACAKLGYLAATLNWRLEREELVHCVDLVEPDVVFVSERYADRCAWIDEDADSSPSYVSFDDDEGESSYRALLEAGSPEEPDLPGVDPEQGLAVIYTSGTTGLPKGAVVSHRAELARSDQVVLDMRLQMGDSYISWAPMFHMSTVDWIVTMAMLGGTYHIVDGFDVERIVEILQTSQRPIAWLFLVPGVIDQFLDYVDEHDVDTDTFAPIRCTGALADLTPPEKVERVTKLVDAPFHNSYGSTEVGWATSGYLIPPGVAPDDAELSKVESPLIDVKLVDENWTAVEQGSKGELAVRGPTLASGYVNSPESNRSEFHDGWFRTGDLFVRNADGTYSYVSRKKYLIKSGGENVYPGEIERVIVEHPLVDDVVVVRVPDEKWGEVPKAYVSTDRPEEVSREELLELLRGRIASYKLPHYIEVVPPRSFPRGTTGKVLRSEVEEWPVSEDDRIREV